MVRSSSVHDTVLKFFLPDWIYSPKYLSLFAQQIISKNKPSKLKTHCLAALSIIISFKFITVRTNSTKHLVSMEKRVPTTARDNNRSKTSSSQLDNESLSSVGSMESASVVANCFDEQTSPPQPLLQGSSSSRLTSSSDQTRKKSKSLHRECPHCKKRLSSYHAVQTHLRVSIISSSSFFHFNKTK